ncbi:hypothetical protein [Aquaspirillum serpens]|nr:hypothetical protein [Aquaspirillum serpens]
MLGLLSSEVISDSMVEAYCQQAAILLHETREWLQQYRPELLQV